MKTEYFECSCYSDEHTLKFSLDEEDAFIYTSVFLNDWQAWYKRLWVGIKYIFGYKCKYGHWDAFNLKPEDVPRLKKLFEELENIKKEKV